MFNLLKKHKIILLILIFIVLLLINTKVNSATTYTFTSEQYYDNMPEAVSNSIKSLSYWNDNSYACFGFHNGAYPYRVVFVKSTSSTVTLDAGHIYFPSVKPYYIFTYNANGTLRSSETYNGNYGYEGISSKSFIFKNVKVVDNSTNINSNNIVKPIPDFYIEYNTITCSYFAYTQWHVLNDFNKYSYFYSEKPQNSFNIHTYDTDGWSSMTYELENENEELTDLSKWRYKQELIDYGEYYFCKYNIETKEYIIYKIVLSEDGNSYISSYNQNTAVWKTIETIENINFSNYNMYAVYDTYSAIIYSNYFSYNDRYVYDITSSLDGINYSYDISIEQYGIDLENDKSGYYRFFKEVTENRTYFFRLQIFDSENNGTIVNTYYFEVIVDNISTQINENETIEFYKNTNVYKYFKKNFGLLFYPIDLMIEFFDRLSKIEDTEPSITVPDIYEPFTQTILINGFTFNLTQVLEDNNILYIYNIYLMFVDFILYVLVFSFMYKVFKTFLNLGGGL